MNFLTAKSLPRRTVLRGLGATMALPFLEAMTPALVRAAAKPVHRFQTFYVPNGMAMEYWLPKTAGEAFEMTPIVVVKAPAERVRHELFRDRARELIGPLQQQRAKAREPFNRRTAHRRPHGINRPAGLV